MSTLSALILAGGHSRRMGTDKALLPLPLAPSDGSSSSREQPLLLHTVKIARQVATEVAVVTPWPSRYDTFLAATDVRLIQEPFPNHQPLSPKGRPPKTSLRQHPTHSAKKLSAGPLSGFAYGWQHITSDWCLLLACDLPYLDAAELTQWWQWISSRLACDALAGAGTTTVGPSTFPPDGLAPMASLAFGRKGWEPLCGFYHRSCLTSLNDHIATAQRAFHPWLQQLSIARYNNISPQIFFNCNTPVEWQTVISESLIRKMC